MTNSKLEAQYWHDHETDPCEQFAQTEVSTLEFCDVLAVTFIIALLFNISFDKICSMNLLSY